VVDSLTPLRRSWNMSRIRGRNTKPEIVVRRQLHRMGYRFTINGRLNRTLPGRPDIVLPKHRTVVFVHGCFWHRHEGCRDTTTPKSRTAWWLKKFSGNVERDRKNHAALREDDWNVVVVWECEATKLDALSAFLDRAIRRLTFYPSSSEPEPMAIAAEEPSKYRAASKSYRGRARRNRAH
jgi:DNA mismatch endonuclease (patch repair protein)